MDKILVAAPFKDRAWAVPYWYDGILAQEIDVTVLALLSASEDETETALKERNVVIVNDERPGRKAIEVAGHHWGSIETYHYMATLRNQLLDIADGYDYFFSLDSDIVLPPGVLKTMLRAIKQYPGVHAPAVNMAINGVAWNTMSWVNPHVPSLAHRTQKHPSGGKVDVVMAAMLLDAEAIEVCSWAQHSQGEDVGFCLTAEQHGVKRYWHDNLRCEHMMRRR
jgi:hypothetical protein